MVVFTYTDTNTDTRDSSSLAEVFLSLFLQKLFLSCTYHRTTDVKWQLQSQSSYALHRAGSPRAGWPGPGQLDFIHLLGRRFLSPSGQPVHWAPLRTLASLLYSLIINLCTLTQSFSAFASAVWTVWALSASSYTKDAPRHSSALWPFTELAPASSCLSCTGLSGLWVHQTSKFI